jgi:hypothetical protein
MSIRAKRGWSPGGSEHQTHCSQTSGKGGGRLQCSAEKVRQDEVSTSRAKPSQAEPSRAKPSQAEPIGGVTCPAGVGLPYVPALLSHWQQPLWSKPSTLSLVHSSTAAEAICQFCSLEQEIRVAYFHSRHTRRLNFEFKERQNKDIFRQRLKELITHRLSPWGPLKDLL